MEKKKNMEIEKARRMKTDSLTNHGLIFLFLVYSFKRGNMHIT